MFAQDAYPENAGPHDYTRAVLNASPSPRRRRSGPRKPGPAPALACIAAAVALAFGLAHDVSAETWRGLTVAPESRCSPYDKRRDYSYPQSVGLRVDGRPRRGGQADNLPGLAARALARALARRERINAIIREGLVKDGSVRAPTVTTERLVSRGYTNAEKTRADFAGRSKSNLSRMVKTMSRYGLVELKERARGMLVPRIRYYQVKLDISLTPSPREVA